VEAPKLKKKIHDYYKIKRPYLKPPLVFMQPILLTKVHRTLVSA